MQDIDPEILRRLLPYLRENTEIAMQYVARGGKLGTWVQTRRDNLLAFYESKYRTGQYKLWENGEPTELCERLLKLGKDPDPANTRIWLAAKDAEFYTEGTHVTWRTATGRTVKGEILYTENDGVLTSPTGVARECSYSNPGSMIYIHEVDNVPIPMFAVISVRNLTVESLAKTPSGADAGPTDSNLKDSRYKGISFLPPEAVRKAARKGLALRKSVPPSKQGGTDIGVSRAEQLVSGEEIHPRAIRRMFSFFSRHAQNKGGSDASPTPGYIAWLLWGGDAGYGWATSVYKQMKQADRRAEEAMTTGSFADFTRSSLDMAERRPPAELTKRVKRKRKGEDDEEDPELQREDGT